MNYINVPIGSTTGWGICGGKIVLELSKRIEAKIVVDEPSLQFVQHSPALAHLRDRLILDHKAQEHINNRCPSVMLQAIGDASLRPFSCELRADFNIGYTFFENTQLTEQAIAFANSQYDIVVTGSSWCESVLRSHGLEDVTTVIQGIDPLIFNPMYSSKRDLKDKFVIFSGGKFELRKGQDLVIRAFKVLHDRYPDVMLVTAWHNHWDWCWETMLATDHIQFSPELLKLPNEQRTERVLRDNGIDMTRVRVLPIVDNSQFPEIYQNTDVGLFPNRCEGGTNLVLMEYMACGKPVIASGNTGHKDVINAANALPIQPRGLMEIVDKGRTVSHWYEPDLDQLIDRLDWAYHNRDAMRHFGLAAGMSMANKTWANTANAFQQLMVQKSIYSRRAKNCWPEGADYASHL